ncbi:hypothetical protein NBRC116596_26350 [Litorivita sp. NS0012-18]
MITEKTRHVVPGLKAALTIGQRTPTDLIDGDMLTHTGQNISQLPTIGAMHQHIPHRHHRSRSL